MAIHCSHCGAIVQRDNVRFCSHCGSFMRSRSGVKVPFTPVIGQELLPEFTKEISSPEEVQEPPLQNAGGDTPTQQVAAIPSLPTYDLSESDNCEDPLSLREESAVPVSEEPDHIGASENMPAEFTQSPPARSEQQDVRIPAASIQENNVEEEKAESERQDGGAIPTISVPSHQEYMYPSDGTSVLGEVQSVPLSGLVSKLRSRLSLWLTVFLVALIIVGVIYWLLILQLAPNTNPWQSFRDTNLGFSVLYPTDWQVQVANKPSIVHFYDSTQTDKVDITISDAATSNVALFLQQQASQLGMTDVTSKPSRSFAGSSWQQVQGKLSQEGVSYNVALLATIHGNHLYLLTQVAPQSTYNDEEALIFSSMRAGLQFL